jgi:hypothetical protein
MIDDQGSGLLAGPAEESLFGDVKTLIEQARGRVAITVNAELTMGTRAGGSSTSKGPQQTALLGLDHGEIRAARYITVSMRDEMRRRLVAAAGQLGAGE